MLCKVKPSCLIYFDLAHHNTPGKMFFFWYTHDILIKKEKLKE